VPQALSTDAARVRRLQRNGQEAYLVGGCVRDLLAGLEPKDFDVATDAHPSRIKRLFHGARIIGRRFRLVHVRFPGDHVIETSTFRGDPERLAREAEAAGESLEDLLEHHGAENFFGTAPEDARRRDFTINALFYDPVRDEVIDWVGGLQDLEQRVVRSIGDPDRRLAEDPVRMIRAVHFAERLGFSIEPTLLAAIERNAARIADASQARLYVEAQKVVSRGRARSSFHRLWELRVLEAWIPELSAFLDRPMAWPQAEGGTHAEASHGEPTDLPAAHATWNLLGAADRWGLAARGAPESLQMAVLFGAWLLETWQLERGSGRGSDHFPAFADHMERTFRPVALRMSVPRWVSARLTDVLWMLLELREPPLPRRRRTLARAGFTEALPCSRSTRARGACSTPGSRRPRRPAWACGWRRPTRPAPRPSTSCPPTSAAVGVADAPGARAASRARGAPGRTSATPGDRARDWRRRPTPGSPRPSTTTRRRRSSPPPRPPSRAPRLRPPGRLRPRPSLQRPSLQRRRPRRPAARWPTTTSPPASFDLGSR
jgi:hypothetical protein